jgi:hypothetical protein
MQNQIELTKQIGLALEAVPKEGITLKEILVNALPNVEEASLKNYFSFIVDGKPITDWSTSVSKKLVEEGRVKVVPQLAGGY